MALFVVTLGAQEPQALVLGKPVFGRGAGGVAQAKQIASEIRSALMGEYARTHGLAATAAEIAAVRGRMGFEGRGASSKLTEQYRQDLLRSGLDAKTATARVSEFTERANAREQQMVLDLIQWWKVGRAVFEEYGGGRVRLSAFGFQDPMDAMERFLVEEERRGSFTFPDARVRALVWAVFQDKSGGDGTVSGARAREIYAKPLWEQAR